MKIKELYIGLMGAIFVLMMGALCPALAATTQKVLVVPFGLNASEDLTHLQRGVVDMLTSRLSQEGKVSVVVPPSDRLMQDDSAMRGLATELGADYIVQGTLTVFGSHVSTDAQVLDVAGNRSVLSFARSGNTLGELIDHIDQLAAEINTRIFGQTTAMTVPPAIQAPPAATPPAPSIHQHPEKLLNPSVQAQPMDDGPGERSFDPSGTAPLLLRGPKFKSQLRGVAAGDVDGDGGNEIACIDGQTVTVFRIQQGRFVKLAHIKGLGSYLGVDIYDLNANGMAEIFVTNYDNLSGRATSFVLEWKEQRFERIADQLPYYFRSIVLPDGSTTMVGQRHGFEEPFARGIYKMVSQGGSYEPGERLPLPADRTVFGFGYGRIQDPGGAADVVTYSKGGYVQILDRQGRVDWSSTERYGGSNTFVEIEDKEDLGEKDYRYIAPSIHLYDMDGDGRQEIWVVKNVETLVGRSLGRLRSFKQGRIEALQWDELGLRTVWKTREISKYIADFILTDLDGDAQPEVVAAVVNKPGSVLNKADSYLAIFKLGGESQSR